MSFAVIAFVEIEDELMWQICCPDKLIDELAKGWAMEKILRKQEKNQVSTRTKSDQYMSGWKVGKIVSGKIYRNDFPKTRKSRIEKSMPRIFTGKGLNDW